MYNVNYPPLYRAAVPQYGYNMVWDKDNERFFFVPLLLGGLGGAAIVGLSRPRPVYVNPSPNYGPNPGYGYRPGGYGYSNYNYYY